MRWRRQGPRAAARSVVPGRPPALGALSVLAMLSVLAVPGGAAGAATVAAVGAPGAARVVVPLPPGLSATEHASLERVGAYGSRPLRLLVVGDSIALTLSMGLAVEAQAHYGVDVTDDAAIGCDLDPQLAVEISGAVGPATPGCVGWRTRWLSLAAGQRPQVVALGLGRWEIADHLLNGRWVHVGQPAWNAHLTADLRSAIAILHSFGAKVVLFTMPYVDPTDRQPDGRPWPENTPGRVRAYNALVRRVARADPGVVSVLDLNRMLGPGGVYTACLSGLDVRTDDGIHVTLDGGELLQRQILPAVDRIGMADEAARARG
jgi:hypothetical protein